MKVIKVNTPNGVYGIPLNLIAEDRANYYSIKVDGNESGSDEWTQQVNFVMEDDFEGIDWLINNFDWDDWKDSAIKLSDKINVNEDDFWTSSDDFDIIELR
jgi:hypothetical protein